MDIKSIMNDVASLLLSHTVEKYNLNKSAASIDTLPDNVLYENKRCEAGQKNKSAQKKRRRVTERVLDEVCANLFEGLATDNEAKPIKNKRKARLEKRQKSIKRGNKVTFAQLCEVCDNLFEKAA